MEYITFEHVMLSSMFPCNANMLHVEDSLNKRTRNIERGFLCQQTDLQGCEYITVSVCKASEVVRAYKGFESSVFYQRDTGVGCFLWSGLKRPQKAFGLE